MINTKKKPQATSRHWLLLRGLGRGTTHWMHFPEKLHQRFSQDTIHTFDLPGNGALNKENSPTTVQAMTEHYRQLLRHNDIQGPINIIGLSLGGMVTLDWLNRYPEEITQAMVINSSNGAFSSPLLRFKQQAIIPLLRGRIGGKPAAEAAIVELTCHLADKHIVTPHFIREAEHHPVSGKNMLRQIKAASKFQLRCFNQPDKLTLVCSEHDKLVSSTCSKSMAMYWNIPLHIHPNAGHDLPLDDPGWLIQTLTQ